MHLWNENSKGDCKMKTRILILTLIIVVLNIAGSCATDKMSYISKDYEIYGTWVNPDAKLIVQWGKVVFHPNGKSEWYRTIAGTSFAPGEYVITNKWIDSTGNIWYTLIREWGDIGEVSGRRYVLAKISDSGKMLELSVNNDDYPKEINSYGEYHILYRQ